jgi:hypothetical protein
VRVQCSIIIRHLLAILVIVGLITGPLAAPAAAGPMQASPMADSMPCCPHKNVPVDCQKCPLAACVSNCQMGVPSSMDMPLLPSVDLAIAFLSDHFKEGLGFRPPSRPPRILV